MTSVKFSGGGDQVIASYSGDNIYSFDCVDHARESEAYCTAQGWSRQVLDFSKATTHRVTNPVIKPNANLVTNCMTINVIRSCTLMHLACTADSRPDGVTTPVLFCILHAHHLCSQDICHL